MILPSGSRLLYLVLTTHKVSLVHLQTYIKRIESVDCSWLAYKNNYIMSQCYKCQHWEHARTNCSMRERWSERHSSHMCQLWRRPYSKSICPKYIRALNKSKTTTAHHRQLLNKWKTSNADHRQHTGTQMIRCKSASTYTPSK